MYDYPEPPLEETEEEEPIDECEGSGCDIFRGDAYWIVEDGKKVCDREDCTWNYLESLVKSNNLNPLYIMEVLGYERVTPDV